MSPAAGDARNSLKKTRSVPMGGVKIWAVDRKPIFSTLKGSYTCKACCTYNRRSGFALHV